MPPQAAMSSGILEFAKPGNRDGVALAYLQLAAWLRAGKAPPPELAEWAADRMEALGAVLRDATDKKLAGVNGALHISEPGRRGKKAKGPIEHQVDQIMVWDVHYRNALTDAAYEEIFCQVAASMSVSGRFIGPDTVAAAWKARRSLVPELFPEMAP